MRLEPLCPKLMDRWHAPPWKGLQVTHRDFSLGHRLAGQCMVVMISVTPCPSKSLLVCMGLAPLSSWLGA